MFFLKNVLLSKPQKNKKRMTEITKIFLPGPKTVRGDDPSGQVGDSNDADVRLGMSGVPTSHLLGVFFKTLTMDSHLVGVHGSGAEPPVFVIFKDRHFARGPGLSNEIGVEH